MLAFIDYACRKMSVVHYVEAENSSKPEEKIRDWITYGWVLTMWADVQIMNPMSAKTLGHFTRLLATSAGW